MPVSTMSLWCWLNNNWQWIITTAVTLSILYFSIITYLSSRIQSQLSRFSGTNIDLQTKVVLSLREFNILRNSAVIEFEFKHREPNGQYLSGEPKHIDRVLSGNINNVKQSDRTRNSLIIKCGVRPSKCREAVEDTVDLLSE